MMVNKLRLLSILTSGLRLSSIDPRKARASFSVCACLIAVPTKSGLMAEWL